MSKKKDNNSPSKRDFDVEKYKLKELKWKMDLLEKLFEKKMQGISGGQIEGEKRLDQMEECVRRLAMIATGTDDIYDDLQKILKLPQRVMYEFGPAKDRAKVRDLT